MIKMIIRVGYTYGKSSPKGAIHQNISGEIYTELMAKTFDIKTKYHIKFNINFIKQIQKHNV